MIFISSLGVGKVSPTDRFEREVGGPKGLNVFSSLVESLNSGDGSCCCVVVVTPNESFDRHVVWEGRNFFDDFLEKMATRDVNAMEAGERGGWLNMAAKAG